VGRNKKDQEKSRRGDAPKKCGVLGHSRLTPLFRPTCGHRRITKTTVAERGWGSAGVFGGFGQRAKERAETKKRRTGNGLEVTSLLPRDPM